MPYGYSGKILRINLTNKKTWIEEKDWVFYRKYLGGRGFISYYLLKEVPKEVDPLSEENKFIVAPSIMTGANVPGFGRHSIGAKSPLTGLYGESEAGGYFGPELKFTGYDAIVIEGKAEKPVYIWINNEKVEIKDATSLWGMNTADAKDEIIKETEEEKLKALLIGKAGENLVKIAGVSSDVNHFHGRAGLGAVMGSKNLKAIAVRGTNKLEIADKERLKETFKYFAKNFKENADNSSQAVYGTSQYYYNANEAGILPTNNFKSGKMEGINASLEEMHEKVKVKTEGCYACPVRCKQVFSAKEPYEIDERYGGPEFEALGSFGSLCGVKDVYATAKANELCNKYSLDVISTGVTIAFAMECFENGIITIEDTDGIELRFGNTEAMLTIVEKIANRDGFGDILAEGSKKAAEVFGKGAIKYAMQTKGQEFPMAEPRAKYGMILAYATSPTGADHIQHEHDGAFDPALTGYSHKSDEPSIFMKTVYPLALIKPVPSLSIGPEKVRLFSYFQSFWSLFECLDICVFTFAPVRTFKITQLVDMVEAVTGWETSLWELMKVGERALTMTRCFNLRNGLKKEDDLNVPDRILEEELEEGLKGSIIDRKEFSRAIDLYYEMNGWNRDTGIPTEGRMYELDIPWALDSLND